MAAKAVAASLIVLLSMVYVSAQMQEPDQKGNESHVGSEHDASHDQELNDIRFDNLEKRVDEIFDIINAVDFNTRIGRLEDNVASLQLPEQSNLSKALDDLEEKVMELETPKEDVPKVCERGMGDDVTKWYRPYVIMTDDSIQKEILCDTKTNGGGWVVIQRRTKGDENFFRNWDTYREGFGSVSGDFWIGNEVIYNLTNTHAYELMFDLRFDDREVYARYNSFRLEDESEQYRLRLGEYSGTVGQTSSEFGFSYSNGRLFSTFDRDNDNFNGNCARRHHGGWWYHTCQRSNMNARWLQKTNVGGVAWETGNGWIYPTYTEMKIRRL